MSNADRYTTLSAHRDSLPVKLAEIASLRLRFVVTRNWNDNERVWLHVFFDDQGMHNYLAENYGSFADDVRGLSLDYSNDENFGAAVRRVLTEIDGE